MIIFVLIPVIALLGLLLMLVYLFLDLSTMEFPEDRKRAVKTPEVRAEASPDLALELPEQP